MTSPLSSKPQMHSINQGTAPHEAWRPPVRPGEPAPDFTLPVVGQEGTISLSDFKGRQPVFLGMFRGLYCAFCRRAIAQMAVTRERLGDVGVESLAIVATDLANARLYFTYRPMRVRVAVDPECVTHGSYGVPKPEPTPDLVQTVTNLRVNPTGELPEPLPVPQAAMELDRLQGYEQTPRDHVDFERTFTQMIGAFLVDRDGIVRWTDIECGREGLSGFGKFPATEHVLDAARQMLG
jgi:peroxiredoxin